MVASEAWYKSYIRSLDEDKIDEMNSDVSWQGTNLYQFGDGQLDPDIPIVLADQHILLNTDIVSSDIHLIISCKAMKNTWITIDVKNDQAFVFGKPEKLAITNSGHYVIPIINYGKLLNNVLIWKHENVMLINKDNKLTYDTALKLHRQFAYPTPKE